MKVLNATFILLNAYCILIKKITILIVDRLDCVNWYFNLYVMSKCLHKKKITMQNGLSEGSVWIEVISAI